MHRGRWLLLGALTTAPALFVAARAGCLCSCLVTLLLHVPSHTPGRSAWPRLGGAALAGLALPDQVIDRPGRARVPPTASQAHELR